MTRMPAVAGQFYPGNPAQLTASLQQLLPGIGEEDKQLALAVVVPHAGYVYSGATAGLTFSQVQVPATVLLLGPNHHGRGAPLALGTEDWDMPLGTVAVDRVFSRLLQEQEPLIAVDNDAHLLEHSLEVQLPFLQMANRSLEIVPLVVSRVALSTCREVGLSIARSIAAYPGSVLLVVSTDMSHYVSRTQASAQDHLALQHIVQLDPEGLYTTVMDQRISMCGVIPTTIMLYAVRELGATQVELVQYTDSGAVSGDWAQVVGYAGLRIA